MGGYLCLLYVAGNSGYKERVLAMTQGKALIPEEEKTAVEAEETFNVERFAKDQIIKLINRKFKGHEFARLVKEILKAQGYTTQLSPPGADGGLDILAASGPLGFEQPRVCVQVKSTTMQVDVKILRELQGVMRKVQAELGLLV
jgi:restriction system protein